MLSNLAQVFGLLDSVKTLVEKRKQEADPGQEQLLSTLASRWRSPAPSPAPSSSHMSSGLSVLSIPSTLSVPSILPVLSVPPVLSAGLEVQLEEQKQLRLATSCPQPRSKPSVKRASKRPRLQRPASSATLLGSPLSQQPQFTVLSPVSLSSVGQPFSVAGLPMATLAQSPSTVTLLPAASQVFTRYVVAGDAKDTFTLHPSSGLTLVQPGVQDSSQLSALVSPLELVQLSQQAGATQVVPVDGTVLVQQEVMQADAGQEHAVIEINPGPMELRLDQEGGEGVQGGRTEEVQGLDVSGQLSTVQIVVLGDNAQEDNRGGEMQ